MSDTETNNFKVYVLKICGNCDFRYSGHCQNSKSPVKRPKRERKACEYFKCWGK